MIERPVFLSFLIKLKSKNVELGLSETCLSALIYYCLCVYMNVLILGTPIYRGRRRLESSLIPVTVVIP